jgi:hypothetical protein
VLATPTPCQGRVALPYDYAATMHVAVSGSGHTSRPGGGMHWNRNKSRLTVPAPSGRGRTGWAPPNHDTASRGFVGAAWEPGASHAEPGASTARGGDERRVTGRVALVARHWLRIEDRIWWPRVGLRMSGRTARHLDPADEMDVAGCNGEKWATRSPIVGPRLVVHPSA